ncbi:DUF4652 domain-containing protein [Clostridium bowmanii]|uniref:DUF4652 domain-containing protein n=1 Tax=Clostridium bowmanii TaxID=132925 RepID=UPI001C0DE9EE|nr:DUF4652 domain-containing protein [Clostridium bowmanii]MBU3188550.1 DUF4652 domain-containing protein [Clostridium bowmanii]MCA1072934.1 DUF4652 domain-containing protein [Clostridium bowmanii]
MSCNMFKDRLEDYVLGNTSNDLKIALEKHMEGCESCRRLYEEEVKIDTDFRMILSIDGIDFNKSRASIIKSIDKNRYSKRTSNKILYNFRRYKNKYLSYAVAVIAMIVFIPIMLKGFPGVSYKGETSPKSTDMEKPSKKELTESNESSAKKSLAMDKADEGNVAAKSVPLQNVTLQFKKSIIAKLPSFNYDLKWKNSTEGKSSAAIDIRPVKDVDFGIHLLYIKNIKTNEIVKYEVINNDRQFTPRSVEWWDNEHLIIVAGLGYGTVAYGSEIYSLNASTGEISTLYQEKDKKQQILEFEKVGEDLIFQLIFYNDDTNNAFHKGIGKMTVSQLEKPAEMQIISEDKK